MPRYNKHGEDITSIKGLIEGDMRGVLPSEASRRKGMLKDLSDMRDATISSLDDEMERRADEPELKYDASGKPLDPETPPGDNDFYWRNFKTQCATCGKSREHGRGWMFCGMTPEGEMKTFCNVDCCNAWEAVGDNTNARRAAIKAQKARKQNE